MLEDQSIESENLNDDDGFLGPNIGIGKVSKSSFHNIWRISPTLDFDLYLYVCAADCLCLTPLRDEQWSEHLEYVPHFFKHPQCVLIRGCPVFFAYRIGHMKAQASPMLELWYKLAPQNGFSGMETRGAFNMLMDQPYIHTSRVAFILGHHFATTDGRITGAKPREVDKFFICSDQGAASFDDLQK